MFKYLVISLVTRTEVKEEEEVSVYTSIEYKVRDILS